MNVFFFKFNLILSALRYCEVNSNRDGQYLKFGFIMLTLDSAMQTVKLPIANYSASGEGRFNS